MKTLLLSLLSVILMAGCDKEKSEQDSIENDGLLGKWKLKEEYKSPGAGGQWYPVAEAQQAIIEFKADGSFNYSSNFRKADMQLDRYQFNGTQLNMSSTTSGNTDTWYVNYLDNKKLEVAVFACFEGCSYRFVPTR